MPYRKSWITVLCVLAVVPLLAIGGTSNRAQGSEGLAIVEGSVVDVVSGLPIPQAQVSVVGSGPQVVSDDSGHFSLTQISPGPRRLEVVATGYVTVIYGERRYNGRLKTIDLKPGQHRRDLVLRLTPVGVISGRVYDLEGKPVVSAEVNALRIAYDKSGNRYIEPVTRNGVTTDDRGEYRLYDIEPGEYFVKAGLERAQRSAGRTARATLSPTYYPGTTQFAQASTVRVSPAAEISAVDIMLSSVAGYTVSGRVLHAVADSPAIRGSAFYLVRRGEGLVERPTLLRNEGRLATGRQIFELRGVPPGSYDLYALRRTLGTETDPVGSHHVGHSEVDVIDRDVQGLTVTIEQGVTVFGRFVVGDRDAAEPGQRLDRIQARLESTDGKPVLAQPRSGRSSGAVAPDGTFTLLGVSTGRYHVSAERVPPDYYLAAARFGSESVLGRNFHVGQIVPGELVLTLSGAGARLSGTAIDADGTPLDEALIVLTPAATPDTDSMLYRDRYTDPSGRFELRGIRPGAYRLYAFTGDIPPDSWKNAAFMRPFLTDSLLVRLEKDGVLRVEYARSPKFGGESCAQTLAIRQGCIAQPSVYGDLPPRETLHVPVDHRCTYREPIVAVAYPPRTPPDTDIIG